MSKVVLPLSDYTNLGKEYAPAGQQKTLWEQFFTGTQEAYQSLATRTKEAYNYDISQAYANYKKQQLQLQMNKQLGEGFKEKIETQLKQDYGSAYENIKSKEISALADIASDYESAITSGEKEFTALGKQLQTYENLISEYAKAVNLTAPENATISKFDESGIKTTELTDYGRLWYSDVLGATYKPSDTESLTFDEWLFSEDYYMGDISREDREAFWEMYRQNPDLFRQQVAGLTSDFNAEETRTKLIEQEHTTAVTGVKNVLSDASKSLWSDGALNRLSDEQLNSLRKNLQRSSEIVSTADADAVIDANTSVRAKNMKFTDEYGVVWSLAATGNAGPAYPGVKAGDIIKINNKYAAVYNVSSGSMYYRYATTTNRGVSSWH